MPASFPNDIRDRLVAQAVGVFGVNIFISGKAVIPSGSGPYLTLTETGGRAPTRNQNDTHPIAKPSMQLLSRATDAQVSRAMLQKAWDALGAENGLHNITLTATFYISITPRQEITEIGTDTVNRMMYAFNIDADIRR
jgi:hypothetical protein